MNFTKQCLILHKQDVSQINLCCVGPIRQDLLEIAQRYSEKFPDTHTKQLGCGDFSHEWTQSVMTYNWRDR